MHVIDIRNVHDALIKGVQTIKDRGILQESRNGDALVMPEPVTTVYRNPKERVIFHPERDANPFFHLMESLWMMAGRRDVDFVKHFAANIANYSDNGTFFHGAYGHRWRFAESFEEIGAFTDEGEPYEESYQLETKDQLVIIADLLKNNKRDRRVVLQMWNADIDLGKDGKDFPCNLICTFRVNDKDQLDMTVFNRSNDMVWGAYGANAVHFSFMQEVMAAWIGVSVGNYWQISTNFHAYVETYKKVESLADHKIGYNPYQVGEVSTFPIVSTPIESWFKDLKMFMDEGTRAMGYTDPFFKKVAIPMLSSWQKWKDPDLGDDRIEMAIASAENIAATDWRKACIEWLERRKK